jgi:hypothetical protein
MRVLVALVLLSTVSWVSGATDFSSLGYTSEPGEVTSAGLDECPGTLMHNHDMTFENGYAWRYNGVVPPYYGAFGEGYAMGEDVEVQCVALWLSHINQYAGGPCDVYVWEGGVADEPGSVLAVAIGVDPGVPATWPAISQHDIDTPDVIVAGGELTVGYWGDWPGAGVQWYCAADLNGPGGHPWTNLAPGSGYGTGWHDPSIVWGPTQSMGLGFYYSAEPTPAASVTWGAIKSFFE